MAKHLPLSAAPFRDQVLMKLISMGLGDELDRSEEDRIEEAEFFGEDPIVIAKDICLQRGWPT
jgi:hypothetical protein